MAGEQKTRCPHCHTTFRVQRSQLEAASGMVRCGKCYKAFNGFDCLVRDPTPAPTPDDDDDFLIDDNFDLSRLASLEGATSDLETPRQPSGEQPPETSPSHQEATEEVEFAAGSAVSGTGEELEELRLDHRDMSRWRPETHNIIPDAGLIGLRRGGRRQPFTWLWIAGSLAAGALLAGQLLYFNSLLIGRDSPLWPLSSGLCPTLGCPLPQQAAPDKILSTNLVIRNHPQAEEALLVDAVIVNTAEFPQPFPPLTLTFENLQGETVARRTFHPREYLMGELAGIDRMPANKPVKLELEIVDPGREAVSFHFFVAK